MYYSSINGWQRSKSILPTPPSLITRDSTDAMVDPRTYDAIPFLNSYFTDEYGVPFKFANTNWSLAQFGSNAYHGIVMRHFVDTNVTPDEGGQ